MSIKFNSNIDILESLLRKALEQIESFKETIQEIEKFELSGEVINQNAILKDNSQI